jgi:adenine phosphoribosyltransferase
MTTKEQEIQAVLREGIRDIPDFPKKGVLFKDITPLLAKASLFQDAINLLALPYVDKGIQKVVGIEARGFIFGAALAQHLGAGFVPVRKEGKLPSRCIKVTYDLEYGQDTVEMHEDAILEGERILIVDDLLATGGTTQAVLQLIQKMKADVLGLTFLIELDELKGREKLMGYDIHSVLKL